MPCRHREELIAQARAIEPTIQGVLKAGGDEAEGVLVLFCKTCACVHVTHVHELHESHADADRRATGAVIEALRLLMQSLEQGEVNNGKATEESDEHATDDDGERAATLN